MAEHAVVVRDGNVIDGIGWTRFRANVAINDDRITIMDESSSVSTETQINATSWIPGFIDVHITTPVSYTQHLDGNQPNHGDHLRFDPKTDTGERDNCLL